MDPKCLIPGDATLIENIVNYLKARGIFDEFRHECLADVDTKSSCQNLSQRVDGYTSKFLATETWHSDLNKNELRNKLRRHIDEAGFLAPGADIVVEQAINPKVYHYFLPKVIEVVHQYVKEQSELLNKKPETISSNKSSSTTEKPVGDTFENKDKTQISDPIADILSFSFPVKTESAQHKHGDASKVEKKKEEKNIPAVEKSTTEIQSEVMTVTINDVKVQLEKERDKIKKEDPEIQQEVLKKAVKDEIKSEKKKADDVKVSISENVSASDESKLSIPASSKTSISSKKDDKNKHKLKSQNIQKSSNNPSEIKKPKKESSEKVNKSKLIKSSKESPSPTKMCSSHKSLFKEEKGESSKTKSHDANSSKTSESFKKSKSSYDKKDSSSSKHKGHSEKTDKHKVSKSVDKNESHIHSDLSSSEKGSKSIQYSSSYDSSQGSDQEKNTSISSKKERPKHFSKHASKEKSEQTDNNNKIDKKRPNSGDESPSKKSKFEKDSKLKLKDTSAVEAAKISSRSNSFGSTSSVSSSSNTSKDNLTPNSDDVSEISLKAKKKKQVKNNDFCQNSPKTLPPPPPPPPPSSSLTSEVTSSAEISSVEDTQSSLSDSETGSSEEISDEASSDSELESKDLIKNTLNENALYSSTDNINAFYDIFLYSSSSSEFEGYGNSPEKNIFENELKNMHESDISISSVHTSDLSSFDDELSSDEEVAFLTGGLKKKLTLKEAQELIENRVNLNEKRKIGSKTSVNEHLFNKRRSRRSSLIVSSDDESPPSEPVRSLRRERKLNPRYSSNEYTSIFNCKKETFITKQTSSPVKSQTSTLSPKNEHKLQKTDSFPENKLQKENVIEDKSNKMQLDEVEISKNNDNKKVFQEDKQLNDSKMSSSDELDSIIDKGTLFKENNKSNLIEDDDKLKFHKKLRPHNNIQVRRNSNSLKRKLEVSESTLMKRPCSRSSVDSSSSEFASNENKPCNNEKKDFIEERKLNDCSLKVSNLNIGIKKDLFGKQRTNNNGDVLGEKDIFPKNSHTKVINNSEKKINESDTSKELSSL